MNTILICQKSYAFTVLQTESQPQHLACKNIVINSHLPRSKNFYYGWVISGTFAVTFGITYGTMSSFGIFFKPLSADLEVSRTLASLAPSLTWTTINCSAPLWGLVADKWSARIVTATCGILIGLGWFLSGTVTSAWQLYLFFGCLLGIGMGGIGPPLVGLTSRWFTYQRGLALGIGFAGLGVAIIFISPLASWLVETYGWRSGMQGFAFLTCGIISLGSLLLRQPPVDTSDIHHQSQAPKVTRTPSSHTTLQPLGRQKPELTAMQAIWSVPFLLLSLMWFAATLAIAQVVVHLVPRITDLGITATHGALILSLIGFVSSIGKAGGGFLGDKIGPEKAFCLSMLLKAAALLWLLFATSLWMFFPFAVAFGLSWGGFTPQVANIMGRIFGLRHMSTLYGALWLGGGMGGVVGPLLAGWVFDVTGSYSLAFILAAALSVLVAGLPFLVREPRVKPDRKNSSGLIT